MDAEPRILLVDDDELSRRMMGLLLSEKGYNYGTASNGLEAVEAVKSQKYDIVLMDLQMPLMNGFDATRKIREWEAGEKHIPIVALTAMLFDNEIQECVSVGMDECVAKPFDTETLFRLVDSYVYKTKSPAFASEFQKSDDEGAPEVLDVEGALPRFSNDIQVYRDFLSEFIIDLPDRIKQFRKLFLDGEYEMLADRAHSLKGISASMGANQLSSFLQLLDQHSQSENSGLVEHMLDEVDKQIQLVKDEANNVLSDKTSKRNN